MEGQYHIFLQQLLMEHLQGILMMTTHSTKFVPITVVKYLIFGRNEGILS
jgi:hypothetical protein